MHDKDSDEVLIAAPRTNFELRREADEAFEVGIFKVTFPTASL